jgi:hypothetical protein
MILLKRITSTSSEKRHVRDSLEACMQSISMSSMSADMGDINNDGHPDIFTTTYSR